MRSKAARYRWLGAVVGVSGLLAFGSATAEPLSVGFEGTLMVDLGSPGSVGVQDSGSAEIETEGDAMVSLAIPAGQFARENLVIPLDATPIRGVIVTAANAGGTFAEQQSGGFGGTHGFDGQVQVCVLAPCEDPAPKVVIPLDVVGVGGTAMVTAPVPVTVSGAPWTTRTVSLSGLEPTSGFRFGPLGSPGTTALTDGRVRLVTPVVIRTQLTGFETINAYATLDLVFTPEPGVAASVAAALLALLVVGRLRYSRQ